MMNDHHYYDDEEESDSTKQTDAAKAFVRAVVRAFYQDEHVCLVDFLLDAKYLRDGPGMGTPLHLTTKQVRKTLAFLQKEHLVSTEVVEGLVVTQNDKRVYRRKKRALFYYVDLNRSVHSIRLRLYNIKSHLEQEINRLSCTSTYECPGYRTKHCNGVYTEMEVANAKFPMNETTGKFLCQECHNKHRYNPQGAPYDYALQLVDTREDRYAAECKLRRFQTQMAAKQIGDTVLRPGIYGLLQQIDKATKQLNMPVTSNLPSENGAEEAVKGGADLAPYDTTNFAVEATEEFANAIYVRGLDGQRMVLDIESRAGMYAIEWAKMGINKNGTTTSGTEATNNSERQRSIPPELPKPKKVCRNSTPFFLQNNVGRLVSDAVNPTMTSNDFMANLLAERDRTHKPQMPATRQFSNTMQQLNIPTQETCVLWQQQQQQQASDNNNMQQVIRDILVQQQQRQHPIRRSNSFPPQHDTVSCTFQSMDRASTFGSVDWQTVDSHGSVSRRPTPINSRATSIASLLGDVNFTTADYLQTAFASMDWKLFDFETAGTDANFLKSFDSLSLGNNNNSNKPSSVPAKPPPIADRIPSVERRAMKPPPYAVRMPSADSSIIPDMPPSMEFVTSREWMAGLKPLQPMDLNFDPTIFSRHCSVEVVYHNEPPKGNKWKDAYEGGLMSHTMPSPLTSEALDAVMQEMEKQQREEDDRKPAPLPSFSSDGNNDKNKQCRGKGRQGGNKKINNKKSNPNNNNKASPSKASSPNKKKRDYKKKPRKIMPEVKTFVVFTNKDVLCQRGTKGRMHEGNKRYRQIVNERRAAYRAAPSQKAKTAMADAIVQQIKDEGGNFLEKDKETGQWFIIHDREARRKAGQACRDEHTMEAYAARREKYPQQQKKKKNNQDDEKNDDDDNRGKNDGQDDDDGEGF